MSIRSIFSCLQNAESKVQTALKAEWNSIPASAQDEVLDVLKFTNIVKANNTLNGEAIIALATAELGQGFTDNLLSVIDKVATSIGITIPAGTDAVGTVTLIASNLTPLTGETWMDEVLRISVYAATNLIPGGAVTREIAIPLIQWAYTNVLLPLLNKPA